MAHVGSISSLDRSVRRHFKKVFNRLRDGYYVREPILDENKVAPVIIEGPNHTWLLVGWHKVHPTIVDLSASIEFNHSLGLSGYSPIRYLAVVEQPLSLLDSLESLPEYIEVIDQDEFFESGDMYIETLSNRVSGKQTDWIKQVLFPESIVQFQCTTRGGAITRDNSASLKNFFLDYDQELAVHLDMLEKVDESDVHEEDFSVRLINGVAGSGKTLILIARALLLCRKYPDKKVLLVIHNKPVTENIKYRIEAYYGGEPDNLDVRTFHSFALKQIIRLSGFVKPLFNDRYLEGIKKQVLSENQGGYSDLSLSDDQIWSEIEYINEYLIQDEATYLEYERQGRGFALQKSQRAIIWRLYEVAMRMLSGPQGYLPSLYIREMAMSGDVNRIEKYHHILVDEAQFFAPSWLQLIKRSLYSDGHIFMCADPNQGFLKSRLSWKTIGLNVRGRTKRLPYSYRTTYEIMVAANALLKGLNENTEDFVQPDLERMERGRKPQVVYSITPQDELRRFLNELSDCVKAQHIPMEQVMVLCSGCYSPWELKRLMEQRVGRNTVINCNDSTEVNGDWGSRIRLMNINSCTGMESGVTFVLGVGELISQSKNLDLLDSELSDVYKESIRRLYVAMTRAGQKLVLFSTECLPEHLDEFVDVSGSVRC